MDLKQKHIDMKKLKEKKKKELICHVGSQSTQSKTLPIRLLPFTEVRLFLYEKVRILFSFQKQ
jgi:hypothetical protein